MTGEDFITLAGKMAAGRGGEAAYRTATSRAYYGAFHIARELLLELKFDPGRDHAMIQRALYRTGNDAAKAASALLSDLQSDRIKADYKLQNEKAGSAEFASLNVESAHSVLSELNRCRDPIVLDEMRRALARM